MEIKYKTTYLIKKIQPDGSVVLDVATSKEWLAAVGQNKYLPAGQRRYFIVDYIAEQDVIDRMVIEAPHDKFRKWHKEHMASKRNRSNGKAYQILSLDALIASGKGQISFGDSIDSGEALEDMICAQALMDDLRDRLARWKPWANDLLDQYLRGQRKDCAAISQKYSVSSQVVCKYKRQFKAFVEKFLAGVSNDLPFCEEEK